MHDCPIALLTHDDYLHSQKVRSRMMTTTMILMMIKMIILMIMRMLNDANVGVSAFG